MRFLSCLKQKKIIVKPKYRIQWHSEVRPMPVPSGVSQSSEFSSRSPISLSKGACPHRSSDRVKTFSTVPSPVSWFPYSSSSFPLLSGTSARFSLWSPHGEVETNFSGWEKPLRKVPWISKSLPTGRAGTQGLAGDRRNWVDVRCLQPSRTKIKYGTICVLVFQTNLWSLPS